MLNLTKILEKEVPKIQEWRLRDRRGFYASATGKCPRDEYWSWTGEPETNPSDFYGSLKMLVGSAIGKEIKERWLDRLILPNGFRLLGSEVPVGGSNPCWDGYIDYLFGYQTEEGMKHFVCELKTAWGYGADLIWKDPSKIEHKDYFLQLGLYLKDFYEKGKACDGCLLFILLSDNSFGKCVQYNCRYLPDTQECECYSFAIIGQDGSYPIRIRYSIKEQLESWSSLAEAISTKVCPKPGYQYKYPVTAESAGQLSDYKLKRIIQEGVVMGDWQVIYSRYKDKQIEADKLCPEYTDEEMQIFVNEYRRRHPRSRI